MNDSSPTPPDDPEAFLRHGLRDTTPEFERRWTALKRQLRTAPAPRSAPLRRWWWALLVPTGLAAAWLLFFPLAPGTRPADPAADLAAFTDLLTLDAELRAALPLTDREAVDDLLAIPADSPDQS
ncbi:MAG TPA: hypothetical protein VK178_08815 [Opitutaceae bacterium]|nr:hypothetical protein [Opitutaceae bacterium]